MGAGHHPFVSVADQPASSFDLDVDTGSPPPSAAPSVPGHPAAADQWSRKGQCAGPTRRPHRRSPGSRPTPPSAFADTRMVRVGVAGQDLPAADRPAANLTFVVDTSGSMDIRERLAAEGNAHLLVLNLRDDDTIAIVEEYLTRPACSNPPRSRMPSASSTPSTSLQPSNSTNLGGRSPRGLPPSQRRLPQGRAQRGDPRLDGVANVGLTDSDGLAGVIQTGPRTASTW